jgi:hypothetical protein
MGTIVFCPFDPETADVMGAAFDAAWHELGLPMDRYWSMAESDLRVKLAEVIIDLVKHGERDPSTLRDHALAALIPADDAGATCRQERVVDKHIFSRFSEQRARAVLLCWKCDAVARLVTVEPIPRTNGISEAQYECPNCGNVIKRTLPRG